jgi:TPP-dependent pyruvate/acetoin dehydrogenase alpha subunit
MDADKLKKLYRELLLVRMTEEKITKLYPEQEMRCPIHLSIGQEATAVGVSANLTKSDMIFSNHRSHGHYLAKGGNLKKFFAELYGRSTGCANGKGGSMHLIDIASGFMGATPIVSSSIPVGVGAAFTMSTKCLKDVVVVFVGDAAVEEGVFHESINYAKLKNLPVLFFCENNMYSVYSHLKVRQPGTRKIIDFVRGHSLDCYEADGNDVIDVYNVTKTAIEKIRNGSGPAFIEADTYRWREHCGPYYDNHIGYREETEFVEWQKKCPVKKLEKKLLDEGIMTAEDITLVKEKLSKEINEAVEFAKLSPYPDREELDKNIYAD